MKGTSSNSIPVIYDHRAQDSALPIQRAAAVVVYHHSNQVLLARRSSSVDEFKGVWSFPSSFIPNTEPDERIPEILTSKLKEWFGLEISALELIGKRMGIRPQWRLLMFLYRAEAQSDPVLQTPKYDLVRWVAGGKYFSQFEFEALGECAKTYLDYWRLDPDHR
jgi:ADP-ribose pyrophosphatase YjhB (NUDIX family)